jgi:LDH2 family malate/lactate/ureidoglycolate dehydrogenase
MAISVEHFLPLSEFKKITGDMMRELRGSRVAPGQERIYTAGEKEYYNTQFVLANGVEIAPGVCKALTVLRKELNISDHDLGF